MARKPSPRHVKVSKHLSYVLRHAPRAIGLSLDDAGWVDVDTLLERSRTAGFPIERALLDEVVATSEKRRFSFSEDGRRIRANQGHTIEVDLGYAPESPPDVLFHGTPIQTVALVRAGGLKKMARHHVHLSRDVETATTVASRRGRPVVLRVDAAAMAREGHLFFVTPNGVWLTSEVPVSFITFPD